MGKTKYILVTGIIVVVLLMVVQFVQISRYNRRTSAFADASIVGQGKPVLLEIGSASCVYCRKMLPVLVGLSDMQDKNFTIAMVSLDQNPAAQQLYRIEAIPTQIFYDGQGNELYRNVGFLSREEILSRWLQLGIDSR